MSEYIVSARKYRPATFDTVVGQSALITTLKNAIQTGKLAHAYLFCGPRGVGKTTSARIFAKTINCMSPLPNGEACNECESCKAFNEGRSFNISELDAASNNGIDEIRQLIEQVRIQPQVGKYKVFIIDEVHMLSTAAFNAFLKTLEEPPHHAIFILATTEKHKLLPTILSRCQIYDFSRMGVEDIVAHLANVAAKEGITCEPAALNVIAQKADGGMRDALSIFDQVASFCGGNITYQRTIQNLNVLDSDYYFRLTDEMLKCLPKNGAQRNEDIMQPVTECMLILGDILSKGFDGQHFINGFASHFRNLLMARDAQTVELIEASDEVRQHFQTQAAQCPPRFLYSAIRLCSNCDLNYKQSQNRRLLVELTLIELAQTAAGDQVEGSGRKPNHRLKPLFAVLMKTVVSGAQQVQAANTVAARTSTTDAAMAGHQASGHQMAPPAPKPTSVGTRRLGFSLSQTPVSSATGIENKMQEQAIGAPSLNSSTVKQTEAPSQSANTSSTEERPFTYLDFRTAWNSYAAALPKEHAAMVARMRIMQPTILNDGTTIELLADNPNVEKDFKMYAHSIEVYLRQMLRNCKITIIVRQRDNTDKKIVYSRQEQFDVLLKRSPGLRKLKAYLELGLE